nr:ribonuclease H-like domain-containing protein [Tanacetum cinerariifolium]
MVTRAQVGTIKPNPRFHAHTSHISPIPKYTFIALSDPNWQDAMYDEYNALIKTTASSTNLLQCIISSLHKEFDMTDFGALNYFLWISVTRDSTSMFLSQKKYALELLDMAHMANCNQTRTSVDTESKLDSDGDPISDPTLYRSLAGGLQYLIFTRPNIYYVVQQVFLHMHDPREPHLAALKRVL